MEGEWQKSSEVNLSASYGDGMLADVTGLHMHDGVGMASVALASALLDPGAVVLVVGRLFQDHLAGLPLGLQART